MQHFGYVLKGQVGFAVDEKKAQGMMRLQGFVAWFNQLPDKEQYLSAIITSMLDENPSALEAAINQAVLSHSKVSHEHTRTLDIAIEFEG